MHLLARSGLNLILIPFRQQGHFRTGYANRGSRFRSPSIPSENSLTPNRHRAKVTVSHWKVMQPWKPAGGDSTFGVLFARARED